MTAEEIKVILDREHPRKPVTGHRSKTALPKVKGDPIPDLVGAHDLVYPCHRIEDHMQGPGRGWLFLTVYPHDLRPHGWVYLKAGGHVGARVRVRGIGFGENLREHTPDDDGTHQIVKSSAILELDESTWEAVSFPAADTHAQGHRYIETDDEAQEVRHLVGGGVHAKHRLQES